MKRFAFILLTFFIVNCTASFPKAEDPLDAAREFIDGCLKGNFKKAGFYMLHDTENEELLKQQEKNYYSKKSDEIEQYNSASIIINEEAAISDTVHIINYQNSYDNIGRKVKVVYRDNKWQVDFKYTFDGNL